MEMRLCVSCITRAIADRRVVGTLHHPFTKGITMGGSLTPIGMGSLAFAPNSGSALVDFLGIGGVLINMLDVIGDGIAGDITASLGNNGAPA